MANNRSILQSLVPLVIVAIASRAGLGNDAGLNAGRSADGWSPVELKPDAWRFVDVDGDCKHSWKGNKLLLETPGTMHDLVGVGQRNAPRLLANRKGDFALNVRVGGRFDPKRTESERFSPYQGAGILVWAGEASFVRLERAKVLTPDGQELAYINFEEHGLTGVRSINQVRLEGDAPLFLRVERRESRVTGFASRDGSKWDELGEARLKPGKPVGVGVAAVNNTDAAFAPEFTELRVFEAKTP